MICATRKGMRYFYAKMKGYENMQTEEILNAKILNVSFGYEDHGILTFSLGLDISGGGCLSFGGYVLDDYDKEKKRRIPTAEGFECLTEIMNTVGVGKWEELKGKYIRVVSRGFGKSITTIGNIMEDKWFNIKKFFEGRRL